MSGQAQDRPPCPRCGQGMAKNGIGRRGFQSWRCKDCGVSRLESAVRPDPPRPCPHCGKELRRGGPLRDGFRAYACDSPAGCQKRFAIDKDGVVGTRRAPGRPTLASTGQAAGRPRCPICGTIMRKYGIDRGRQVWVCCGYAGRIGCGRRILKPLEGKA